MNLFLISDLMGDNLWEEAMNDAIVETCVDSFGYFGAKILRWKVLDFENEPDDSRLLVKNVYKSIERAMEFIQEEAEKRDAKFLTCDRVMHFLFRQSFLLNKIFIKS